MSVDGATTSRLGYIYKHSVYDYIYMCTCTYNVFFFKFTSG